MGVGKGEQLPGCRAPAPFQVLPKLRLLRADREQRREERVGEAGPQSSLAGGGGLGEKLLFLATSSPAPPGGRLGTHLLVFVFSEKGLCCRLKLRKTEQAQGGLLSKSRLEESPSGSFSPTPCLL